MSTTRPAFDLLDPHFYVGDPHGAYEWMRTNEPVYRDEKNGLWAITKHADVVHVEAHDQLFVSGRGYRSHWFPEESNMISSDDPQHAEQRGLVARRFTPRAVHDYEPDIATMIEELLAAALPKGRMEVIGELAAALPGRLTCRLLGFPEDRWNDVKRWSEQMMRYDVVLRDDTAGAEMGQAIMEFASLLVPMAEERRGCPMDDLVSVWVNADMNGRRYELNNLIDETGLFISGGAETTRTVIARSLITFAEHPDQWELLHERPELMASAVDEMIRWVTPLHNFFRTATAPSEIRGVPIAEGDRIVLLYPAANRDPEVFGPTASQFDVTRDPNPHVAFGRGTHFCLGASLARLELRMLFAELTRRITNLRVVGTPRYEPNVFVGAVQQLDLEFDLR